jgi:arylsulfatase A-like enzyme
MKGSALSAAGLAIPGHAETTMPSNKPNLLFIFPDQFRRESMGFWDKPRYGGALRTPGDPVVTPVLDRLADESVVFTQAVSTCPVCSPYRGMMMSGMYPWQNGVINNCHHTRKDGLRHDIDCFTDVLADAGYETAYVGKTHWERNDAVFDAKQNYVGTMEPPGGHHMNPYDTYIPPGPGRHGSTYWYQCVKDAHKDPRVYSSDAARTGRKDGEQYRPEVYSPLLEADVLIDYLTQPHGKRDPAKPFCAIWAPNPPHSPYGSEKDCDELAYREFYRDKTPEELLIRKNVSQDGDAAIKARRCVPFYFANVTGIDKQIGRVLEALEASGEAGNTIVVFTSDHGEMMGSQGKFGKLVIHEESFCIPLLVKYPGKLSHRLEDMMLAPVDIMPTLLGLIGLGDRIPDTVEGRDYSRAVATGDFSETEKPRSALFLGYSNRVKGVRTDRFSFQIDHRGKQVLFDNEVDPYQVKPISLGDIPKADSEMILGELAMWLKVSNDPWYRGRKFANLIPYPA